MSTLANTAQPIDTPSQVQAVVHAQGLVKHYSDLAAVDGLTFAVEAGTIYGLLGRNSAGKTTTLKLLMGLARPQVGEARVFGLDPTIERQRIEIYRRTGFVSDKSLFVSWTLKELLKYNSGFFPNYSAERANSYAEQLDVPLDQKFARLSLGNKTKACLVLALSQGADLLVLDEPTQGLDPVATDRLLRILTEDFAGEGKTVLFSSHQLAEVERIADRVGIIDHGRMKLEVNMEDLRADYRWVRATRTIYMGPLQRMSSWLPVLIPPIVIPHGTSMIFHPDLAWQLASRVALLLVFTLLAQKELEHREI